MSTDSNNDINNDLTLYDMITTYSEAILTNKYIDSGIPPIRGKELNDSIIEELIERIPKKYLPLILSDDHMFSNLETRANAEVIRWHYLHDYSIADSNSIARTNTAILTQIRKLNFPLLEMLLISVVRSEKQENICGNNSSLPLYLLSKSLKIESILGTILLYDANLFYIFLERILEFNSNTVFIPEKTTENTLDSRYQLYQWVDFALTYRVHNEVVLLNDIILGYDNIVSSIQCSSTNDETTFPIASTLIKYTPSFDYYKHYGLYMNNYCKNKNNNKNSTSSNYYINLETKAISNRIEIKNSGDIPFFTMSLLVRTCVNYNMLKNILNILYNLNIDDNKQGGLLAFKYPSTHILISKLSIDDNKTMSDNKNDNKTWKQIDKYPLADNQVSIVNNFIKNITQPIVTILGYDETGHEGSVGKYSNALGFANITNPLFKNSFPLKKDNWSTSNYSLSYRGSRNKFPKISENIDSFLSSNVLVRPKTTASNNKPNNITRPNTSKNTSTNTTNTTNNTNNYNNTNNTNNTNNNIPILFHRRLLVNNDSKFLAEQININNFNQAVNNSNMITGGDNIMKPYIKLASENLAKKFTPNTYMNYLVNEETDKSYDFLIDGSNNNRGTLSLNDYLINNVGYTKDDFSTINIFVGSSGSGKSTTIGTALYISTQVKSNYGKLSDDVLFTTSNVIPIIPDVYNTDMGSVTRGYKTTPSNGYYGINVYKIIPDSSIFLSIIEPSTENETSSRNAILWNTVRVLAGSTIGSKCVSLIDTMGFENVNIDCYGKTRSIKPLDLIMYSTRKGITVKDIASMLKMMPIPSHTIGNDGNDDSNNSWEVPDYPKRVNELIESFSAILDTCKTFHQYNNVIDTNQIHEMKNSDDKETLETYNEYKKNPIINYLLNYTEAKYKFLQANKNTKNTKNDDNNIQKAIPYIEASMKYVFSITLLFSDNLLRKERDTQVFELLKVFIENDFEKYINNLITPQHIKTHILSDRFD
jgi:hypothetical protein